MNFLTKLWNKFTQPSTKEPQAPLDTTRYNPQLHRHLPRKVRRAMGQRGNYGASLRAHWDAQRRAEIELKKQLKAA
ncbi:hypothetical protein NB640_12305 [Oxalobacter vibrioformis]|uniref:Uncharacterized protein n=1 Tax=Oxalobacter vibrioformis TaxID=933080 RepID=A0A9E9M007_9BURK|nr:hypothetical protein [Oxalobacter vibrioformis]WAW09983.1 hypothetical protein NB640_12305 [Oxalobacter vibrioformis]